MSQYFLELVHGFIVFVLWSHVNFRKDDEEGYFEEKAKSNVFLCHLLDTHVGTDNNTAEVRREASESIDGGFQVFFVSTQVDERNYLVAVIHDFLPVLVLVLVESLRQYLVAFLSEAQDFLTNRAGPSRFLLVEVVKHPHSGTSVAVVSDAFGQDGH